MLSLRSIFVPVMAALCAALLLPAAGRAQQNGALSPQQVRDLLARVVAAQHRNDEALMLYERREHRITRKKEMDAAPEEDKLYRVVPTGTGTVKLVLADRGTSVTADNYREQLRYLEQALAWALDPAESKQKARVQKYERRSKERFETVEAAQRAFDCVWNGREEQNGKSLVKLLCAPNPAFKPGSRTEEMFLYARATLWIEPRTAQLARVEAELTSDVSVGAGVIGKAYRGGRFLMEQSEVAPGVWLPAKFHYNLRGRKFFFGFEMHEETTVSHYRRIGPPVEALAAIRSELSASGALAPLPANQ